jgi:hypothetical protein
MCCDVTVHLNGPNCRYAICALVADEILMELGQLLGLNSTCAFFRRWAIDNRRWYSRGLARLLPFRRPCNFGLQFAACVGIWGPSCSSFWLAIIVIGEAMIDRYGSTVVWAQFSMSPILGGLLRLILSAGACRAVPNPSMKLIWYDSKNK